MPKLKTVKGVKDRVKVTATGKLVSFRAGRRHLLGNKSAKSKRHLRKPKLLFQSEAWKIKALLPYA